MNSSTASSLKGSSDTDYSEHGLLSDISYIVMGSYLTIVDILAILGNLSLLAFFSRNENRKNTVYLFYINIAVADMIETVFGFPLAIYSTFKGRWEFGSSGCYIYAFTCFTAALNNMMTYVSLSIYRFYYICSRPDATVNCFESSKIFGIILSIWIYSLLWSIIPFIGWGSYGLEKFQTSCSIAWTDDSDDSKSFIVSLFIFVLFIPVIIMGFMYVKIVKTVQMNISPQMAEVENTETMDHHRVTDRRHGITCIPHIDKRVIKIVIITMASYLIAWTPYGTMSMMAATGIEIPLQLTPIPTFLAKTQTIFNPLIFFYFHDGFRQWTRKFFFRN